MAHITYGKIKTNMFLLWAGSDTEDIYKNLHISSTQQYDNDAIFEAILHGPEL